MCGMTDNWKSEFLQSIQTRNSIQTDCFIDLFSSYSAITENLRRLLSPDKSDHISSLQYDSEEEELLDMSGEVSASRRSIEQVCRRLADCTKEKKNILEKNLALRDQVRVLESRVRSSDHEVRATRSCLKELEVELRDKEIKVYEMGELLNTLSLRRVSNNEGEKYEELFSEESRHHPLQSYHSISHPASQQTSNPCSSLRIDEHSPAFTARAVPTPPLVSHSQQMTWHRQSDPPASITDRPILSRADDTRIDSMRASTTQPPSSSPTQNILSSPRRAKVMSRPHSGSISALDISTDNNHPEHPELLVSGGYDGYLALLDPNVLSVRYSFRVAPNESGIVTLQLSEEDHNQAIAACLDTNLYIADLGRQKTTAVLKGHTGKVTGCGFVRPSKKEKSVNIRCAFSVSLDRCIRLWDLSKSACLTTANCSSGISCSAVKGDRLTVGHLNGCISLWELLPSNEVPIQKLCTFQPLAPSMRNSNAEAIHEGQVSGICFSPDGTKVYSVGRDGRIAELSVVTGQMVKAFHFVSPLPSGGQGSICLPNGQTVVTASATGLACWEVGTGRCVATWDTPSPPTCVTWTGELLSSGHTDGTIVLWEM